MVSEESRAKIGLAHKGRALSEEHKAKISLANKGRSVSEEVRRKISESHKGKIVSEETKAKISKGKIMSLVWRQKSEVRAKPIGGKEPVIQLPIVTEKEQELLSNYKASLKILIVKQKEIEIEIAKLKRTIRIFNLNQKNGAQSVVTAKEKTSIISENEKQELAEFRKHLAAKVLALYENKSA